MFGQLLLNKNKILQYCTVLYSNLSHTKSGEVNTAQHFFQNYKGTYNGLWDAVSMMACLDPNFSSKLYYAKRKFFVTLKYRHMHRVLNVDKIKN
jgi:hypothetical protein